MSVWLAVNVSVESEEARRGGDERRGQRSNDSSSWELQLLYSGHSTLSPFFFRLSPLSHPCPLLSLRSSIVCPCPSLTYTSDRSTGLALLRPILAAAAFLLLPPPCVSRPSSILAHCGARFHPPTLPLQLLLCLPLPSPFSLHHAAQGQGAGQEGEEDRG